MTALLPSGTPCWVDVTTDDPHGVAAFYSRLFGWQLADPGDGGYFVSFADGRPVAGIRPRRSRRVPSGWSTYFSTDDVDATAALVRSAGGTLLTEPFEVLDSGRTFFATAPDGSSFGVWQGRTPRGAGLAVPPCSFAWNELHSRDLPTALWFYATVFGFTYDDRSTSGHTSYVFNRADDGAGLGGMGTAAMMPVSVPSVWLTWFAVPSCDDAADLVPELEGSLLMAPTDSPYGRMAVAAGSQGEVFGLIDLTTTCTTRPPSE